MPRLERVSKGGYKMTSKLITIKEACSYLSISRTTLYGLIRAERIPVVKIGKRGLRLSVGALDTFIAEEEGNGQH